MKLEPRLFRTLLERASLTCALAVLSTVTPAVAQTPLTLEQAMTMAKPDFMGSPVTAAWWSADSRQVYYQHQLPGAKEVSTFRLDPRDGTVRAIDAAGKAQIDGDAKRYDVTRTRAVYERDGDIWLRDVDQSAPIQVTRTKDAESEPRHSADGTRVFFLRGTDWFAWTAEGGVETPLLALRADNPPLSAPAPGGGVTVFLGPQVVIKRSTLSPSGRHALVVTTPKGYDAGRVVQMPMYLTASGYPEMMDLPPRIGRNDGAPQSLWLVDVQSGRARPVDVSGLPGIAVDPLADLRAARKLPPLVGLRGFETWDIQWSEDGRQLAFSLTANDNRDAWLAALDVAMGQLSLRDHDRGASVITGQFGFLPDDRLWFTSEREGWFGLYLHDGTSARKLAVGAYNVMNVQWSADGKRAFFQCNRKEPGDYEICRVNADGGDLREVTSLDGVGTYVDLDAFRLSPDGHQLAVRYSGQYLPMQLALVDAETGETRRVTDTRSEALKAGIDTLIEPEFVQIPSSHFKGMIWGKLFRPKVQEPGRRYPIVLLLHGGNVVQFVARNQSMSFSETMLANYLAQNGYLVLEFDYRGSMGYGKSFRESVYRRLGITEVEDMRDVVAYLADHHRGDPGNAGTYGCSYGGYLAYMSAFLAPDLFKAAAAANGWADLPATMGSNPTKLLDTPDLNPEAFRASSATTHVENLRGELLILHNVDDSAVTYEHALRVVQRLLDLGKQNWNIVSYPTGNHCFEERRDLQIDAFRRAFQMFERTLKPQ